MKNRISTEQSLFRRVTSMLLGRAGTAARLAAPLQPPEQSFIETLEQRAMLSGDGAPEGVPPTVTMQSGVVNTFEQNAVLNPLPSATFTLSRSSSISPLTIFIDYSGTAAADGGETDFALTTTDAGVLIVYNDVTEQFQVTLPDGLLGVTLTIDAPEDRLTEGTETAIFTLASGAGYQFSVTTRTVNIQEDVVRVDTTLTDGIAAEVNTGGTANGGIVRFTRINGAIDAPLTLSVFINGTAIRGTDFTTLIGGTLFTGAVVIPAGQEFVDVAFSIIDDGVFEGNETIIVTLATTANYESTGGSFTVNVADRQIGVTISSSDSAAAERVTGPANTASVTFTRTGSTIGALLMNFTLGGTGTFNSAGTGDYTLSIGGVPFVGTTITIPAGSASVTILLTPNNDLLPEQTETAIFTLIPRGNTYDLLAPGSGRTQTLLIADDEPSLTISASDGSAAETEVGAPPNLGTFTIFRNGNSAVALTVPVTFTGTALRTGAANDYTLSAPGGTFNATFTTITIPAGVTSVVITVTPRNDLLPEPAETVIMTLGTGAAFTIPALAADRAATITIADDEPVLSIAATDAAAGEPSDNGTFTITRAGSALVGLTVPVTFAGTALRTGAARDYNISISGGTLNAAQNSITILTGSTSVVITITPVDDAIVEATETIIVTLGAGAGYALTTTTANRTATATITDDEPTVTLSTSDFFAAETPVGIPADGASFNITRTGSLVNAITIPITFGGRALRGLTGATPGADYTIVVTGGIFTSISTTSGTIVLPAGVSAATITYTIIDDRVFDQNEEASVTIGNSPTNAYRVSTDPFGRSDSIVIIDDEPRISLVSVIDEAGEIDAGSAQQPGRFRLVRTGSSAFPVTVGIVFTGTASRGILPTSDYTLTSTGTFNSTFTQLTIPAGTNFVIIDIVVNDDAAVEASETVIATLSAVVANGYEITPILSQTRATATIADNEPTLSITTSDSSAGEGAGGTGAFTIARASGSLVRALTIPVTFAGTALRTGTLADYTLSVTGGSLNAAGTVLTLDAGSASATITVTPTQDVRAEPTETVTLTLGASAAAYRLPTLASARTATLNLIDDEATISIVATDATAIETVIGDAANLATFTLSRTGSTTAALLVPVTIAGTALRTGTAADYTITVTNGGFDALTGVVTIDAGAAAAIITITPNDDAIVELAETVIVTLRTSTAYTLTPTLAQRTATVTIADNEPVVSIIATDATAIETITGDATNLGTFTLSRTGSTTGALLVPVTIAGTALRTGTALDYAITVANGAFNATTGVVTIDAGSASVVITITPNDDAIVELAETVIVTLRTSTAYTLTPTLAQRTATVTIADNEPVISIVVTDGIASETAAGETTNLAIFTLSRTGSTTGALLVPVTIAGTALRTGTAVDYTIIVANGAFDATTGVVTIDAGSAAAIITITPTDDAIVERAETVIVTLRTSTAYSLTPTLAQRTATATIDDNEPVVSISATDASAAETDSEQATNSGTFTITRVGDTTSTLTVPVTFTGAATRTGVNSDYAITATGGTFNAVTGAVTFTAGSSAVVLSVEPVDDAAVESLETVIATLGAGAGFTLNPTLAQRTATANITDNESVISVGTAGSLPTGTLAENATSPGTFVFTRNGGSTSFDLVVNFTLSGTATSGIDFASFGAASITIPAGQSSATLDLSAVADGLADNNETVIVTLAAGTGYGLSATASQRTARYTITDTARPAGADLQIVNFAYTPATFSQDAVTGAVTMTVTIRNNGLADSVAGSVELFVGRDRDPASTAVTQFGTAVVPIIAAGATATVVVTFDPGTAFDAVLLADLGSQFIRATITVTGDANTANNFFLAARNNLLLTV